MNLLLSIVMLLSFQDQQAPFFPDLNKPAVKKMNQEIEAVFGNADISKVPVVISDERGIELVHPVPAHALFFLKAGNDHLGYLYLSSASGRFENFDYMVLYNTDMVIEGIRILVYRSDHGHEIMNKRWLQQFVGTTGCGFSYPKDIQALSGATYSAGSITSDLDRLCKSLKELRALGIL